jgi:membrane glycosyltransferase
LVSRLHLARGVASYLIAPLWFALLVMSALLALKPAWGVSNAEIADQRMAGAIQANGAVAAVFVMSMTFLIAPKIIAFLAMLASTDERARFGGARSALAGLVVEILISALLAPVLMLHQIWALISIFSGRDSGWSPQHREEDALSLEDAANQHLGDTAVGVSLGVAAWSVSLHTLAWLLPVVAGMVLCIPIAAWTSRREFGDLAARWGLLRVPEEIAPSDLIRRFNALQQDPRVEPARRPSTIGSVASVAPVEA